MQVEELARDARSDQDEKWSGQQRQRIGRQRRERGRGNGVVACTGAADATTLGQRTMIREASYDDNSNKTTAAAAAVAAVAAAVIELQQPTGRGEKYVAVQHICFHL